MGKNKDAFRQGDKRRDEESIRWERFVLLLFIGRIIPPYHSTQN